MAEIPIRAINFDVLGTEAILLGILAEGKSLAAQVLFSAGVSYDAVLQLVKKWVCVRPTPPEGTVVPDILPFAPRMKRVIELAVEEAQQVGESRITPSHVLLGMLKEYDEVPPPGGVATYILGTELSISLEPLEVQLRQAITHQ